MLLRSLRPKRPMTTLPPLILYPKTRKKSILPMKKSKSLNDEDPPMADSNEKLSQDELCATLEESTTGGHVVHHETEERDPKKRKRRT